MKNVVRLMGVGLLVAGQLVACGGEVEGVEEAPSQSKPVMSNLHRPVAGAVQKAPEAVEGRVHQLGPAPNLSSIQVIAVCSDAFYAVYAPYDCEDVSAVSTTGFNHGGTWMVMITKEMGYRQTGTQVSTMAGIAVPEVYNEPILNVYNEMIGWYRYFEPTASPPPQSGLFKYSARSINTYTQYSDQVTIQ